MPDWIFYGAVIALIMLWLVSAELNYRAQVEANDVEWEQIVHYHGQHEK